MNGGPGFRVKQAFQRPEKNLIAGIGKFATADISDALNRMFAMDAGLKNLTGGKTLCGPAVTVKVFPGDNLMLHKALDLVQEGDVLVVDTSGSTRNAVMGDMIANKARHRGVAGCVIDGLLRDLDGVHETKLPVFARGVTAFGPLHRGPGEVNFAVSCGGIVVEPGDIIVGDDDGVVVVRKAFADTTLAVLTAQADKSAAYIADVKRGVFSNDWVDQALKDGGCRFD